VSSFAYLLSLPRHRPPAPVLETHAHLGSVIVLTVSEGVLGGWLRGGPAGGLVGGLIGLLVGPILAWWLWLIHRRRRGLGRTILLGLIVQAVATLLIAAAVQWLVGVPILEVAAAVTALILLGGGLPLLMALAITWERTWATRGALAGLIVAALLALGNFCFNPPPWRGLAGVAVFPAALAAITLSGALVGAAVFALGRALVRLVRRQLIRLRCHRRGDAEGEPLAPPRLDLADVAALRSVEPAFPQTALLLLAALREGVSVMHFETLGAICRVTVEGPGCTPESWPVPLSAEHFAALLRVTAVWDRSSIPEEQTGQLAVTVGEQSLQLPLWLHVAKGAMRGRLHFPPLEAALAKQVQHLWKDYQEYHGDFGSRMGETVTLQREPTDGSSRDPQEETSLRLVYAGKAQATGSFSIQVEFDGCLLGTLASFAGSFDHHVRTTPGPHLLQLVPTQALAAWRARTFLVNIVDPGVYEVRLKWDIVWGGFKRQAEVRDWTEEVQKTETFRSAAR
jgi:hypothetical protein